MKSKPPASRLDGKDERVCGTVGVGDFYIFYFEEERLSCFEIIYFGYRSGWGEVKLGQFCGSYNICKEEIFASFDWL